MEQGPCCRYANAADIGVSLSDSTGNSQKLRETKDKTREERISMEIIVDANGPEEQAMGWYYYLEEKLQFPFTALCRANGQSRLCMSMMRLM